MRLARFAGIAAALSLAAVSGGAQEPTSAPAAKPPELTLWSPTSANPLMNGGMSGYYISVDRDAYVAAFEVGRDGRMRVLYPRSPKDAGKLKGGKTVSAMPWSYDLFGIAVTPDEVPYVIALASDDPIDLAQFGKGKTWQYRVRLDGGRDPDGTIETVARLVASDSAQRFAADFGYVAPRISVGTQLALAQCASLASLTGGRDAHDYWLYRDLWVSFGPRDGYWFASVSPWIGWGWNGMAPLLFPSMAAWPTPSGCSSTLRLPSYAYAPSDYQRPVPRVPVHRDSTVRDSTMKSDSAQAGTAGRRIAVEQPRGEGAGSTMEALVPGAARRFSPSDIARIRERSRAGGERAPALAEAIAAGSRGAAPVARGGVAGWTAEPMDARPRSRGGSSSAEQAELSGRRYFPAGRGPSRNDPERVHGNVGFSGQGVSAGGSSGAGTRPVESSGSSSAGWQRPTSVGGADVTRNAAPRVAAPAGGSTAGGTTTPKGQQQQQQQQQ